MAHPRIHSIRDLVSPQVMASMDKISATVGATGTVATIALEKYNGTLAFSVGVLTAITLLPLAIIRWRGMLYDYHVYASYNSHRNFKLIRWVFSPSLFQKPKSKRNVERRNSDHTGWTRHDRGEDY